MGLTIPEMKSLPDGISTPPYEYTRIIASGEFPGYTTTGKVVVLLVFAAATSHSKLLLYAVARILL